jgi:hypothetical protein
MPGFLKAATTVFVGGALAVLPSMPESALALSPRFAGVRVADLPPAPCKQQLWPNTDRSCQTWTMANPAVQAMLSAPTRTLSSQPSSPLPPRSSSVTVIERTAKVASTQTRRPAIAERDDAEEQTASVEHQDVAAKTVTPEPAVAPISAAPAIIERLSVGETAAEAVERATRAPEEKPKVTRNTRDVGVAAPIPIASRTADGTKRVIMIRPTSRQDALYYSARRELAANALLNR